MRIRGVVDMGRCCDIFRYLLEFRVVEGEERVRGVEARWERSFP